MFDVPEKSNQTENFQPETEVKSRLDLFPGDQKQSQSHDQAIKKNQLPLSGTEAGGTAGMSKLTS